MIDFVLFILCLLAILVVYTNDFKQIFIVFNLISLLSVLVYTTLHSYDVAMTEVAVGLTVNFGLMFYLMNLDLKFNKEESLFYIFIFSLFSTLFVYNNLPLNNIFYYLKYYIYAHSIPCFVSEILASFRGFDTLCETFVIFITSIAILNISNKRMKISFEINNAMRNILEVLIFFIALVALYIHLNGEISPGGGFQAAALFFVICTLCVKNVFMNLHVIGMAIYIVLAFSGVIINNNIMYFSNIVLGIQVAELAVLTTVTFAFFYILHTKFSVENSLNINLSFLPIFGPVLILLIAAYTNIYIYYIVYLIWLIFNNSVLNIFNFLIILLGLFDFMIPFFYIDVNYSIIILILISLPMSVFMYLYFIIQEMILATYIMCRICIVGNYYINTKKIHLPYENFITTVIIYSITFTPGTISYKYDNQTLYVNCVSEDHAASLNDFVANCRFLYEKNILNFIFTKLVDKYKKV